MDDLTITVPGDIRQPFAMFLRWGSNQIKDLPVYKGNEEFFNDKCSRIRQIAETVYPADEEGD